MEKILPRVVAVLVVCDPGPFVSEVLESIASQDVEIASIVVIDTGNNSSLAAISSVMPSAFYARKENCTSISAAYNSAFKMVEGATHFWLLHDDVVVESDTLRKLLEYSFRLNAGVVGPKVLSYESDEVLVSVGMDYDKFAVPVKRIETGEMDQGQHDQESEVGYVEGGCQLIRADLVKQVGGFDEEISFFGEDLNFGMKARLAGARQYVVPSASCKHMQLMASNRRKTTNQKETGFELIRRHELRTVLEVYTLLTLVFIIPQLVLLGVLDIAYSAVKGELGRSFSIIRSFTWNINHLKSLKSARSEIKSFRAVGDKELRSYEMARFERIRRGFESKALRLDPSIVPSIVFVSVFFLFLLIGTRGIVGSQNFVGQYLPLPNSSDILHQLFYFGNSWHSTLYYSRSPIYLFYYLGSVLTFMHPNLFKTCLYLALLPLGMLEVNLFVRKFIDFKELPKFTTALAIPILFVAFPVVLNDIANGSISSLALLVVVPSVLRAVTPIVAINDEYKRVHSHYFKRVITVAVGTAFLCAMLPIAVFLMPIVIVVYALYMRLSVEKDIFVKILKIGVLGILLGVLIDLPFVLSSIMNIGNGSFSLMDVPPGVSMRSFGGLNITELLGMSNGNVGIPVISILVMAVISVATLLTHGKRRTLANIGLCFVGVSIVIEVLETHQSLRIYLPSPDITSTLCLLGLSFSFVAVVASFAYDLRKYSLGLRHAIATALVIIISIGFISVLPSYLNGNFYQVQSANIAINNVVAFSSNKALGIGRPGGVPGSSVEMSSDVNVSITKSTVPSYMSSNYSNYLDDKKCVNLLEKALNNQTDTLGSGLSKLGVQWIVLESSLKSNDTNILVNAFSNQVDLKYTPEPSGPGAYEVKESLSASSAKSENSFNYLEGLDLVVVVGVGLLAFVKIARVKKSESSNEIT